MNEEMKISSFVWLIIALLKMWDVILWLVVESSWNMYILAVFWKRYNLKPERKKNKNNKQTGKISTTWGKKNKRNVEFSYIALFKVPFWKVCFKQAEINAEAVGLSSCWTPEAEDAYSHIRTHIALILHLVLINTNRAYLHRASLQISHVQSHLCFMVQGILCYCLQSCSIVW